MIPLKEKINHTTASPNPIKGIDPLFAEKEFIAY
jgi:hypothetical protein